MRMVSGVLPASHSIVALCSHPINTLGSICMHTHVLHSVHYVAGCVAATALAPPAVLSGLKGRFFFGDLVCKWYAWVAKVVESIALKRDAGDPDVARLVEHLPPQLLLTQEQVQAITPATSAVHSNTHVWWCQVRGGGIAPDVPIACKGDNISACAYKAVHKGYWGSFNDLFC